MTGLRRLPPAVALALALLAVGDAAAEADGPDFYKVTGVRESSTLNVRAGPSPAAEWLGALEAGAHCLENLGCVGEVDLATWLDMSEAEREAARDRRWCRIRRGTLEGWVAGRYLAEDDLPSEICRQRQEMP